MANILPSIEKLSGRENYNNWAFAMQAYLEHEDLWSCIVDTPDTPEQQKRDAKAKSKIIMMVHTANFVHIRSGKTAKEVWEKLREAFQDSGLCRKVVNSGDKLRLQQFDSSKSRPIRTAAAVAVPSVRRRTMPEKGKAKRTGKGTSCVIMGCDLRE
ncbi:protein of unknown function (DUF4219) [Popillia japonica]|uniref:DUF4219 domain-containing protein n=1 Tax=Popillia japonica TaxID=7064 RepID=A0AAW1LY77_POPJA